MGSASDILCLDRGSSSLKFSLYTVCDEDESRVSSGTATARVCVVPTDENPMIARQTRNPVFREGA